MNLQSIRSKYPYQSENGVELDFNFWVSNRYLTIEHIVNLLDSLVFKKKPLSVKTLGNSSSNPSSSVVCLFLQGFDPYYYTDHQSNLSFLTECSSMPFVSAKIDPLKASRSSGANDNSSNNNANPWFWNDVKNILSLLLWPTIGSNLLHSFGKISGRELFVNHQINFVVSD
jgi:hypothetical protein